MRTLTLIVRDRAAAEDLAQDAFVQLLRHWPKVSRYESPDGCLRRVAVRMAVREDHRVTAPLQDDCLADIAPAPDFLPRL